MRLQRGFWPRVFVGLLTLVFSVGAVGQTRCSPEDLKASLPSDAPAYRDAIALSATLTKYGISVKCVLMSKMDGTFDGQDGSALYRTDHGDFDVLFLPQPKTFDQLTVIEQQEGWRYSYRFKGPPQPWPANLIDSAYRIYFIKNQNMLFVVDHNKELATNLAKLAH
jgi:hypothetical protein